MVSNEDRDAAIDMIWNTECIFEDPETPDTPSRKEAHLITDAYIAHGWGPRPRVRLKRIEEFGRFPDLVKDYLESCGIEVTDS